MIFMTTIWCVIRAIIKIYVFLKIIGDDPVHNDIVEIRITPLRIPISTKKTFKHKRMSVGARCQSKHFTLKYYMIILC